MSLPGRPPRGRGPEDGGAGGAAMSASRGGILIGLAVVVGILIFTTIDGGVPSSGTAGSTDTPSVTDSTPATNPDGTPATTVEGGGDSDGDTSGARANDQVVVQVLNGSGVQGAATQRSNDLKAQGYQVLPTGNAPATRDGTAVQCKNGYAKEADVLVATLGELGVPAAVEEVPDPLPAGFDAAANCYVILGR